jgi:hypothetical protein
MYHLNRVNSFAPQNTAVRRNASSRVEHWGRIGQVNMTLAVAVGALLLYYVVQVNSIAATTWKLRDARDQLSVVREERNTLVARVGELDDRTVLQALAERQGLVPADGVVYIVQSSTMAAVR